MKLEDLQQIKSELKRFSDKIDEGIQAAKLVEGRTLFGSTEVYGKHDISGTRMAGSIKRQAQELKYYLTKKL